MRPIQVKPPPISPRGVDFAPVRGAMENIAKSHQEIVELSAKLMKLQFSRGMAYGFLLGASLSLLSFILN